ncbi:MAG TPA: hypothetical protein VI248_17660 [Kineosporiaceae bacterium]
MTRALADRLLAGWCAAAAVGIAIYWATWFSTAHTQPWLPTGYVTHERVFIFTDIPMALLLAATAVLLVRGSSRAAPLALFTGGTLAFLGVIDTAYFAQNAMFDPAHDGVANLFIVGVVLALAITLVLYVTNSRGGRAARLHGVTAPQRERP